MSRGLVDTTSTTALSSAWTSEAVHGPVEMRTRSTPAFDPELAPLSRESGASLLKASMLDVVKASAADRWADGGRSCEALARAMPTALVTRRDKVRTAWTDDRGGRATISGEPATRYGTG